MIAQISGRILVIVSLGAGAISASTAYRVSTALPDSDLVGLTLNEDAGVKVVDGSNMPLVEQTVVDDDDQPEPVKLSSENLALLRSKQTKADGNEVRVTTVRVKEFSLSRWSHAWIFAASIVGMIAGAVLGRWGAAQSVDQKSNNLVSARSEESLTSIAERLGDLQNKMGNANTPDDCLKLIVETAGELQRTLLPDFVATHPTLIRRFGVGPAAEVMDRFAAAERQINRAWSAASDGDDHEAADCLQMASQLLEETRETLQRKAAK